MRKVLYALSLILIVLASVAGYEFYVIEQQSVEIREQALLIQEHESVIETQLTVIQQMNGTIVILQSEKEALILTVEEKDRLIDEFKVEVERLKNALQNTSHWPDLRTLKRFLIDDDTDKWTLKRRAEGVYDCEDFALDLQKAAYRQGYFLSVQIVTVQLMEKYYGWEWAYPEAMTHACNLAYIINENSFYIVEPQTDKVAFLFYAD